MSPLTLSRRSLLPSWTNDLFDTGKLFNGGFPGFNSDFPAWDLATRMPTVNIMEDTKEFKLEMAVPGMEKKDFHISVENEMLTIRSEKKEEMKEKKENYTRREFSYSSFSRSFQLPENCLPEKIDAKYDNGILRIFLPKKEVTLVNPVKEIKVS